MSIRESVNLGTSPENQHSKNLTRKLRRSSPQALLQAYEDLLRIVPILVVSTEAPNKATKCFYHDYETLLQGLFFTRIPTRSMC